MNQFNILNKKAARFCNCLGVMKPIEINKNCECGFEGITFFEYLTEELSNILLGEKLPIDIVQSQTGELLIPLRRKITKTLIKKVAANYNNCECSPPAGRIDNKLREYIGRACQKFNVEF